MQPTEAIQNRYPAKAYPDALYNAQSNQADARPVGLLSVAVNRVAEHAKAMSDVLTRLEDIGDKLGVNGPRTAVAEPTA